METPAIRCDLQIFINLNGSSYWSDVMDKCIVVSGVLPARHHHLVAGLWRFQRWWWWILVCPFTNRELPLYQLIWKYLNVLTSRGWMLHISPVITIARKEVGKLYFQFCRWRNCAEELNDFCKVMRPITGNISEGRCLILTSCSSYNTSCTCGLCEEGYNLLGQIGFCVENANYREG